MIEHRLHQLTCGRCGALTRATLPEDVNPSGYGVQVVAMVALLSGVYRNSQRMVQSALADLFGVSMSLGTVNTLRVEASNALANCVDEAKQYVQQQPVVGADVQRKLRPRQVLSKVISTEVILNNGKLGCGLLSHRLLHSSKLL